MTHRLHLPAGTSSAGAYDVEVSPATDGLSHSSLRVLTLEPGATQTFSTGDEEMVVLPLAGSATVDCDGENFVLHGRTDVFSRVSDCLYVPRDAQVSITSAGGGRFALTGARCTRRLPARYRAAEDIPVEVRGAGSSSRQVNNFCRADSFEADRLIAVEVLTPGGNWSSYPPHKHDEAIPGQEAELEEIYYFETAGIGYQRVYGTPERPIEVLAEVRQGDVVLVPHGWHGPTAAAPGYDLYYLNVMAGPGDDRTWLISDDPDHAWVRATWDDQVLDPRLPMATTVDRRAR